MHSLSRTGEVRPSARGQGEAEWRSEALEARSETGSTRRSSGPRRRAAEAPALPSASRRPPPTRRAARRARPAAEAAPVIAPAAGRKSGPQDARAAGPPRGSASRKSGTIRSIPYRVADLRGLAPTLWYEYSVAGYSGTPLPQKLGIRDGSRVRLVG